MKKYTFEAWDHTTKELYECPFCGGEPEVRHNGNDYLRKKEIVIKCRKCRATRTDAALRHGFDWLEDVAVKAWNQRPQTQ